VEDAFDLTHAETLENAIMTYQPLTLAGDQAIIDAPGLKLVLRPAPGTRMDRIETHFYNDHDGKETSIHRLVLVPEPLSSKVSMKVEMTLL
jgi:hypothetical protein